VEHAARLVAETAVKELAQVKVQVLPLYWRQVVLRLRGGCEQVPDSPPRTPPATPNAVPDDTDDDVPLLDLPPPRGAPEPPLVGAGRPTEYPVTERPLTPPPDEQLSPLLGPGILPRPAGAEERGLTLPADDDLPWDDYIDFDQPDTVWE